MTTNKDIAMKEQNRWHDVQVDGLPPCDDERVFVGYNSQGFAACFNHVRPDGLCMMGDPESSTAQMSGLRFWRELDEPGAHSPTFDLIAHLHRQRGFSLKTFGPGLRTAGVSDHIRKELIEIAHKPTDVMEWIDVVLLALDGAWRTGATPEGIVAALEAKQTKNEGRTWPDWRTAPADKAIEHVEQKQ
ncbi:dATP/dGTP pyrophosphohydrolase domain-containing protein [Uliginosibacterium sp. sgz301328]|uniref:dATP/dGTP pyrophosphohydrolase domain-containing protein n=1 Tax=Uliginosibacterium sp. sgz301328 TaxID=3243764 RepID=UPI00359E09E1